MKQGALVYWLIGISIITVMIAVLAVADTTVWLDVPLVLYKAGGDNLPVLLLFAIIFILLRQRQLIPFNSVNTHSAVANVTSYRSTNNHTSHFYSRIALLCRPLIMACLIMGLVIGSALQALMSYQQAEAAKITQSMRVQAVVKIEGISDSVYDSATMSGYRQVATISQLSPLVSELTVQELDDKSRDYLSNLSNAHNSLSSTIDHNSNGDITSSHESIQSPQYRVLLNAYPSGKSDKNAQDNHSVDLNHLQPGDQRYMTLALAPLASSKQAHDNPTGFDSYRWLRSRHIDGVATILASSSMATDKKLASNRGVISKPLRAISTGIDNWRWQLRQHFYRDWGSKTLAEQQADAVTLSLLTGDRSLINSDTKALYQLAGISHLLAISGTHVLFLAIMLAAMATLILDRKAYKLYRYLPRWQARWWVMIAAAFVYALFTGFDVPAARTAWMLLAIGLIRLTLLPISTLRVLLALAILMAWLDPYVLWQAGYWLSFIAVALLLKYEDVSQHNSVREMSDPSPHLSPNKHSALINRVGQGFKRIVQLQCWLFVTLLPVTLLLFGKASLWGLIVNLFAIGLFGWVIVPLNLLAGLCYMIAPASADIIWSLVSTIVGYLHEFISWLTGLSELKGAWLYTPVNTAILLMALLVMLPWLLPRGLLSRWLALPTAALLMMTVQANQYKLSETSSLYVLPTGDPYISAAVLQYSYDSLPSSSTSSHVTWLFLADHRTQYKRSWPSNLSADKLSAILEQQLRSLSIKRLDGLVVQTSNLALTDSLNANRSDNDKHKSNNPDTLTDSALLPMTALHLNQRMPISQYWQAGRRDQWSALQRQYIEAMSRQQIMSMSAQECVEGKTWQSKNGSLSLQAITGWQEIDDKSVWDCTISIESHIPIKVLKYNTANPLQSLPMQDQVVSLSQKNKHLSIYDQTSHQTNEQKTKPSRLVLDAATHKRLWSLWSLLCTAEPLSDIQSMEASRWLGHSTSSISAETFKQLNIDTVMTYDEATLETALATTKLP